MKAKNSGEGGGGGGGWGLGLLLVFFFDEETHQHHHDDEDPKYIDKKRRFSSSSSSLSPFKSTTTNNNSTINTNLLISKAQSTTSICALIFFFTLLLFTLCTFEPPISSISPPPHSKIQEFRELGFSRRWLPEKKKKIYTINPSKIEKSSSSLNSVALQGMGTLFRRGTKAMNDLIVAHLTEDTTDDELRLFLRTLHRSTLMAKSDLVFIFPSSISPNSSFSTVIRQENESFIKLVHHYRNNKTVNGGFDLTQFLKSEKKQEPETLWGRRVRSNYSNSEGGDEDEEGELMNDLNYGSVVSFEADELDTENSLSGFILENHHHHPPPIRLRRWACYPMLLGRVRRNFKHVMLVDVKNVAVLGDPLVRVRNRTPESVYLWKNSEKTQSHKSKESKSVTADAIMGGMRGIRRLSNAMLNEIVKAAIHHHHHKSNKNSVTETVILSQLVHSESLLKSLEVVVTISESPIPDSSSSSRNHSSSSSSLLVVNHGSNSSNHDLKFILWKEICSSTLHSSLVYRDC